MKYNSGTRSRQSMRLKGYNYSQAALYFITICTQYRMHFFGEIKNHKMILNDAGVMIQTVWDEIPEYYQGINIHTFQIMPDHIHGIIEILGPKLSLPDIMHRFKSFTTNRYADGVKHNNWQPYHKRLWQRNYYERIIRDDKAYNTITRYIVNNPQAWKKPCYK